MRSSICLGLWVLCLLLTLSRLEQKEEPLLRLALWMCDKSFSHSFFRVISKELVWGYVTFDWRVLVRFSFVLRCHCDCAPRGFVCCYEFGAVRQAVEDPAGVVMGFGAWVYHCVEVFKD